MLRSLIGSFNSRKARPQPPAGLPASAGVQEPNAFFEHLMRRFFAHMAEVQEDNFDYERFQIAPGTRVAAPPEVSYFWFGQLRSRIADFKKCRDLLEDEASRDLYEDLILYRLLMHLHMRLPANNAHHWAMREQAREYRKGPSALRHLFPGMYHYEIDFLGEKINLNCWDGSIAWSFLLGQYFYHRDGVKVQIEPGDVVIDAGACLGDTSFAFAAAAGREGRVFSFEIMPDHLQAIEANLALNPELASRIEVIGAALSSQSDLELYIHGSGPSAKVSQEPSAHRVAVMSIDELCEQRKLPRVDFIKMDIEGAEYDAISGARETIKRHRPKLAISLYHRPMDICDLPLLIDSLGVDYVYYLDHYTIHTEETVLYAVPRK